jgi:uncharacterized membrane protein
MLAGYEQILPGAAERIFRMAELEQQHRHETENKNRERETSHEHHITLLHAFGQVSGLMLGMTGMAAGTWLSRGGKNITGFATFIVSLGTLVGVFIYQRRQAGAAAQDPDKGKADCPPPPP